MGCPGRGRSRRVQRDACRARPRRHRAVAGALTTRQRLEGIAYEPLAWEDPACPGCDSRRRRLYERFGDRRQYTYQLCRDCRMVYLAPRPVYDESFVHDAYEYYAEQSAAVAPSVAFLESTRAAQEVELDELFRFDRSRTALLDVGCALGNFLYAARSRFAAVYGLEVSGRMAAFVEDTVGVPVYRDRFEDLEPERQFTSIRMSHVLEHVPDPGRWLTRARAMLAPGGVLSVAVPNQFALDKRAKLLLKRLGLRRGRWASWRTPDHLFEPTVPGMRTLFARTGWQVEYCATYSARPRGPAWAGVPYHGWFRFGSKLRFYARPAVRWSSN